jgi:hypothetical protein
VLDRGDGSIPRDQQRARDLALPGRVDLEPEAFDEAVGEKPVLRGPEPGLLQHRARSTRQIWNQIGADHHHIDFGIVFHEFSEQRQLNLAGAAGDAPEVHQCRTASVRAQHLLPASPHERLELGRRLGRRRGGQGAKQEYGSQQAAFHDPSPIGSRRYPSALVIQER